MHRDACATAATYPDFDNPPKLTWLPPPSHLKRTLTSDGTALRMEQGEGVA